MLSRPFIATVALLLATTVHGADVWSTPYPGIQMLKRTTARPVVFWALVVDSCAPGIRFRVSAPNEGNRVTSSFGRLVGAQMAINGDFADHDFGLNVGEGQVWPYPDTTHSGNFSIGANRLEMTPDFVQLAGPAPWVTNQLGGRWTLLDDGVPNYGIDDNGPASGGFVCAPGLRHPRTAIGLSQDKSKVIILVADGRSSASVGMTCDEMIDVFRELGAHDAMGLDGGGSSTLWKNDVVINHPTDANGERVVRNHLALYATGSGPAPHCGRQAAPPEPAQAATVAAPQLPTVIALTPPSRFTPTTPTRLFDTRLLATSTRLMRSDGSSEGPISLTSDGAFTAWSSVGAPAGITAAWLNVTAIGRTTPGFLTVFPHGQSAPSTSNVNFGAGAVVANAVPVALGAGGQVNFQSNIAVDVVADLSGVFGPSGAGLLPITPTRVLDTRSPALPLMTHLARAVDVDAPPGAVAVAASIAVIARGAPGFLTAYPCGAPVPGTSNINFAADAVVANAVVTGLGNGQLCLDASTDVDVVVDVTGYFTPGAALSYVSLFPKRLLDTRTSTSSYSGRVAAGQVLRLPVQSLTGMPAQVGAVVANVTVSQTAAPGFVTAFPCGGPTPATSTVNFAANSTVGGLAMMAVGQGALCVVSTARAHLIVDVMGVWAVPPAPPVAVMDAGFPVITEPDAGVVGDVGSAPEEDAGVGVVVVGGGSAGAAVDGGQPEVPMAPVLGAGCSSSTMPPATMGWLVLVVFAMLPLARRRAARH